VGDRNKLTTIGMVGMALANFVAACAPTTGGEDPLPGSEASQCRAAQYERYVGQSRSALPRQPNGETWRISCTTCAVTMDYNPRRLNIVYDEATGVIREVKCG
jgi:hypothetical protein